MITEFIGLPGSGKTYISDKVVLRLGNSYTRAMLEKENASFLSSLKFVIKIKRCFFLIVISFLVNVTLNLKKTYALFLGIKDILKLYTIINNHKIGIAILDEGIHQRILSILFFNKTKLNQKLARTIFRNLNDELKPDLIVIVDVDINKSMVNAVNRQNGLHFRYRDLSEKDIVDKYESMCSGIELIENNYRKDKGNIVRMSEVDFSIERLSELI